MEECKLFESEYRFMDLVWDMEPVKSTELAKACYGELGWKKSTCYTVLKKLSDRGFIKNEQAVVTSLIGREEVQKYESEAVVKKNFNGSLPAFLTAFLKDRELSREEAEEIRKMIEDAVVSAED
ncbi:BlaI/MecI/CopY family transcriptional regulator [Clostridium sp. MCC353]|uniref:BlaI/MecI/CopY family transcriptional regulator n=1 Tax=Clostridium sp. MCC353 TaxID=2592646 RepID=UPI001C035B8E|nr:BlaI/MecI/CopY family transcriptional regulator [Clostridium sp. MCC353]MBT9775302.1 BlaI/MecI/CopY family transcriptional regulator [Clostridium sp. MCC353]